MTKENSVISRSGGQSTMSSREIAKLVGSRHDSVRRTVERLAERGAIALPPMVEKSTAGRPAQEFVFSGEQGKRDSIVVVAQLSPEFTARLVDRWMELEARQAALDEAHASRQGARLEAPLLTDAIKLSLLSAGKEAKHYHFSNEFNMINRLVLGCTSRQFRNEHGLSASAPVRDALTPWEIKAVEHLQRINTALLEVGMPYAERKARLEQVLKARYMQAMNAEVMELEA